MVMSDSQILEKMKIGAIVIDEFNMDQLGPNSYDVLPHHYYWVMDHNKKHDVYHRLDGLDYNVNIQDYFVLHNALDEGGVIEVNPGDFILLATEEFVGTPYPPNGEGFQVPLSKFDVDYGPLSQAIEKYGTTYNGIVAQFITRSTWARWGLDFEKAGMGDVGFNSRWTLELENNTGVRHYIELGIPVGQFVFHETGPVLRPYRKGYSVTREEWTTTHMLPSAKRRKNS